MLKKIRLPFTYFLALRYLKPKRTFISLITLISILGVVLGISVLIIVISVMTGFERELQNLRAKWGAVLAADPYYSPVLTLDPIPFSALAWPARAMEPRVNAPPVPTVIH